MKTKHSRMLTAGLAAVLATSGCDKGTDSFSLLSASAAFKQSTTYVQRKIDILWVIDTSGSMRTSQTNIANNFSAFINRFQSLGYDFHMGVTSTDAYLHYHFNNPNRSRLKDGVGTNRSGVYIMNRNTPNLQNVFMTNIMLGTSGSGDERAFSSMEATLNNPLNAGFRRPGAFLAVIIVSDEDDYSHYDWGNGVASYYFTEDLNDPNMFSVTHFKNYLDTLTNSSPSGPRNYSVSAITILDNACLAQLTDEFPERKIGRRYLELVEMTGGQRGSLCGDFASTLSLISDRVIELSTTFRLDREPYESTIVVTINGAVVPRSNTNGWSYDPATWSITFHGQAIPQAGADVKIYFDPKSVKL
ncbi:MAG: hypothetical protein N2578_06365 [Bdellovibrionaceae bacterium]|nr:hypothetical protein [Pseudobdellovibrionaceae bacterium]